MKTPDASRPGAAEVGVNLPIAPEHLKTSSKLDNDSQARPSLPEVGKSHIFDLPVRTPPYPEPSGVPNILSEEISIASSSQQKDASPHTTETPKPIIIVEGGLRNDTEPREVKAGENSHSLNRQGNERNGREGKPSQGEIKQDGVEVKITTSEQTDTKVPRETVEVNGDPQKGKQEVIPRDPEEGARYLRDKYRAGLEPQNIKAEYIPFLSIIKNQLIFPSGKKPTEAEIDRVLGTATAFLSDSSVLPISVILTATQTILDDARALRERGVTGDTIEMAMRHPIDYYLQEEKPKPNEKSKKTSVQEKKAIVQKPLTDMTAGEVIAVLRKEAGITQARLAEQLQGFNQVAIWRVEQGKRIMTRKEMAAIVKILLASDIPAEDQRIQYLIQQTHELVTDLDFEMFEVRMAREVLIKAIQTGTSVSRIARAIGKSGSEIKLFASGEETVDISQGRGGFSAPTNERNEHLQAFYKIVNEMRWLRTFSQMQDLPPTRIAGRGLKLLRLTTHEKQSNTRSGQGHHSKYETGKRLPTAYNLKERIKDLGLDLESKAAQYLLLHSADGKKPLTNKDKPMTLADLQICELRDLMRYLRRLKGAEQEDVAKALNYNLGHYRNLEDGNSGYPINNNAVETFITWLELHSESTLAQVLRQKQKEQKQKQQISTCLLESVLTEQYLFQEHLDQLEPYHLSESDRELKISLESMQVSGVSISKMLLAVIGGKTSLYQFAKKARIDRKTLWNFKTEDYVPEDRIIVNIAEASGYGPHHPIQYTLLTYAEQQRAA